MTCPVKAKMFKRIYSIKLSHAESYKTKNIYNVLIDCTSETIL